MIEISGIEFKLPGRKPVTEKEKRAAKIAETVSKIDEALTALESGFYFDEDRVEKLGIPLTPLTENMYRVIIFQHLPRGVTRIKLNNGKIYTNPRIDKNELDDTQTWTMIDIDAYFSKRFPNHWK